MYIHHTSITIHFFFLHIFHSPGQPGCPSFAVSATYSWSIERYILLFVYSIMLLFAFTIWSKSKFFSLFQTFYFSSSSVLWSGLRLILCLPLDLHLLYFSLLLTIQCCSYLSSFFLFPTSPFSYPFSYPPPLNQSPYTTSLSDRMKTRDFLHFIFGLDF